MLQRTSVSSIFRILAATLMLPWLVLVGHTQDERVPDGMRVATVTALTMLTHIALPPS